MALQRITEADEIKAGDSLIDKHPVSLQETNVTVLRVTKTRIITNHLQYTKDGCNPDDRLLRFRSRLFKQISEQQTLST